MIGRLTFYNFVMPSSTQDTFNLQRKRQKHSMIKMFGPPELAQGFQSGKLRIDIPGNPQTTCKNAIDFGIISRLKVDIDWTIKRK